MNQNSPGKDSLESDIEMIDIHNLEPPPKPQQNGHTTSPEPEWDDDDETLPIDDGSRGLLSGSVERTRFDAAPAKVWPQVRSIVIEVRNMSCSSFH